MAFAWFKRWRLQKRSLPEEWRAILAEHCPWMAELAAEERARFEAHLKVFALGKYFEGVKGQVITDEVRVVISAAAARLVRNLPLSIYDHLTEIVVYPSHYRHEGKDGIVFGEAHRWGVVVLSWDATLHGLSNPDDGHDTALHEFAHVLDNQDGVFDGTPILAGSADYHVWARAFTDAFERLRDRPGRRRAVMRDYGATNEAEFFAVATEAFFEKPRQLNKAEPHLYGALVDFYKLDPANSR